MRFIIIWDIELRAGCVYKMINEQSKIIAFDLNGDSDYSSGTVIKWSFIFVRKRLPARYGLTCRQAWKHLRGVDFHQAVIWEQVWILESICLHMYIRIKATLRSVTKYGISRWRKKAIPLCHHTSDRQHLRLMTNKGRW